MGFRASAVGLRSVRPQDPTTSLRASASGSAEAVGLRRQAEVAVHGERREAHVHPVEIGDEVAEHQERQQPPRHLAEQGVFHFFGCFGHGSIRRPRGDRARLRSPLFSRGCFLDISEERPDQQQRMGARRSPAFLTAVAFLQQGKGIREFLASWRSKAVARKM